MSPNLCLLLLMSQKKEVGEGEGRWGKEVGSLDGTSQVSGNALFLQITAKIWIFG